MRNRLSIPRFRVDVWNVYHGKHPFSDGRAMLTMVFWQVPSNQADINVLKTSTVNGHAVVYLGHVDGKITRVYLQQASGLLYPLVTMADLVLALAGAC